MLLAKFGQSMEMESFWKEAFTVGGIATIGAFICWSISKIVLALPIFPKLTKRQSFTLLMTIVISAFFIFGLGAWTVIPSLMTAKTTFPLTVYVHGENGPGDMILKNTGYVLVDVGSDRRKEAIDDKGKASFLEIPANFRGKDVTVALEADGFELAKPDQKYRLDSNEVYVLADKKAGQITGWVQDAKKAASGQSQCHH